MNLSTLLASRDQLNEQARLANTAYAYATLKRYAKVVQRSGLSGPVRLQQPDEEEERFWASLTPLLGNQSVVEEHFTDEDVCELADAVAFVHGIEPLDLSFEIERLEDDFLPPLVTALRTAGVKLENTPQRSRSQEAAEQEST